MTIIATTAFLCATIAQPRPARLTVDQIIAGMTQLDDAFNTKKHSYIIEYEKRATYHGALEGGKDRNVVSRVTHARKGQKILVRVRTSDDFDTVNNNQDAWYAWDGQVCGRRIGTTVDYYSYLNPVPLNYFDCFRIVDVDTYKWIDAPFEEGSPVPSSQVFSGNQFDAQPRMLRENRSRYLLRPMQELVDGAWCHVLEWPGYDVIWVDPARSFVTRRREYRIRGLLRSVRVNKELVRHAAGVWLPSLSEQTAYLLPGMPPGRLKQGDATYKQQVRLLSADFDHADDRFFKLPIDPRERLLVNDAVRHMSYVRYPEGTDPIDAALKDVRTHMTAPTWQSERDRLLFLANAFLLNLAATLYLVRRIVRSRAPSAA